MRITKAWVNNKKRWLLEDLRRVAAELYENIALKDKPEVLALHRAYYPYRRDEDRPAFAAAALFEVLELKAERNFPQGVLEE